MEINSVANKNFNIFPGSLKKSSVMKIIPANSQETVVLMKTS